MKKLNNLGEFGLIERLCSRLRYRSVQLITGVGDDCAVFVNDSGNYKIASTDALVESVHFKLANTSPKQLGRKALSVNLSDIAAMGGVPWLALVTLGIPKNLPLKFLDGLYDGFDEICLKYGVELAGGDTVSSPNHLFINITVIGEVKKDRLFLRSGARPGDAVFVTGSLGDSALGLKLLNSRRKKWCGPQRLQNQLIKKHLDPVPRLVESGLLAQSNIRVSAMIDVSDGLAQDLHHLCKQSGVGARLNEEFLPHSRTLERICSLNRLNYLDFILSGGEDYELLFTIKSEDVKPLLRQFLNAQAPVTLIGEITQEPEKIILTKQNGRQELLKRSMGYNHFKAKDPPRSKSKLLR